MIDLDKLDTCILQYEEFMLNNGLSSQRRGQLFNRLIADVLRAHFIDARYDQRSIGEIDVSFRVNDRRFILEAKWEKGRVKIDPVAKLGLRISQRIQSNIGVLLSMGGFTENTLKEIEQAGRPTVLLIEKDIFEALIYGTIEARILFDTCIDIASFDGKYHIKLSDVFKFRSSNIESSSTFSTEICNEDDVRVFRSLAVKGEISQFRFIKSDLPFGQNGISISGTKPFITLSNGLYVVDP